MKQPALQYFDRLTEILEKIRETQTESICRAAEWFADATLSGHRVFAVGCGHAGLLAQELFYRSGGLVTVNPIFAPGLQLDVLPITLTSQIERMEGYGRQIIEQKGISAGDVLLIHSVSGRNPLGIDMAIRAKELGARVIALTNLAYSSASASRHSCGKRLFEVADLVLDNCGDVGDAAVQIDGFPEKSGPTSTAAGAAILNAVVAQAVGEFMARGVTPPVFVSANLDGGDAHNKKVLEEYKNQITYM